MLVTAVICAAPVMGANSENSQEQEISATEDLMREHGVLDRILLIYEECRHRIETKEPFDADTLGSAGRLVQSFIENYHEKLEENHIFPQFEKVKKQTELVKTLRKQHAAGRVLTQKIIEMADNKTLKESVNQTALIYSMQQFIRLYRPHKAREDTVLFPELHSILSQSELAELGDTFEDKEHDLFGKDGFEKVVDNVAVLEKNLGIYDLSQFTPSR